jgi:hypothetical protein
MDIELDKRNKIIEKIIDIIDRSTNESIKIDEKKIDYFVDKFSAKKTPIYKIKINDFYLNKKNNYNIAYECVTCNSKNIVCSTQFIRKVNKCSYVCYSCKENDENKKQKRLETILNNNSNVAKSITDMTFDEKYNHYKMTFNDEFNDEEKKKYFNYHLTIDEYDRIKKNIIKIGQHQYSNDKFKYYDIYKSNNQMLYTSVFILEDKYLIKNQQLELKCDNCENNWICKNLHSIKNCIKIFCKLCKCSNKIFIRRKHKNCENKIIIYQSKFEKKFIDYCNKMSIVLYNGPTISYYWKDAKEHKYYVDFIIEKLGILIELKDEHIWHKKDVESGKWQAKVDACMKYIENKNLKEYLFITPKNYQDKIKYIYNKYYKENRNKI